MGMGKTLIKGGAVIDGTGSPPIEGGAILLEGERIIGVGKKDEFVEKQLMFRCWIGATKRFFPD